MISTECASRRPLTVDLDDRLIISAQRVGFFNIGSGRVLDKIPGSGSVLGRVGVSEFLFYIRVFPGMFRYFWVTFIY